MVFRRRYVRPVGRGRGEMGVEALDDNEMAASFAVMAMKQAKESRVEKGGRRCAQCLKEGNRGNKIFRNVQDLAFHILSRHLDTDTKEARAVVRRELQPSHWRDTESAHTSSHSRVSGSNEDALMKRGAILEEGSSEQRPSRESLPLDCRPQDQPPPYNNTTAQQPSRPPPHNTTTVQQPSRLPPYNTSPVQQPLPSSTYNATVVQQQSPVGPSNQLYLQGNLGPLNNQLPAYSMPQGFGIPQRANVLQSLHTQVQFASAGLPPVQPVLYIPAQDLSHQLLCIPGFQSPTGQLNVQDGAPPPSAPQNAPLPEEDVPLSHRKETLDSLRREAVRILAPRARSPPPRSTPKESRSPRTAKQDYFRGARRFSTPPARTPPPTSSLPEGTTANATSRLRRTSQVYVSNTDRQKLIQTPLEVGPSNLPGQGRYRRVGDEVTEPQPKRIKVESRRENSLHRSDRGMWQPLAALNKESVQPKESAPPHQARKEPWAENERANRKARAGGGRVKMEREPAPAPIPYSNRVRVYEDEKKDAWRSRSSAPRPTKVQEGEDVEVVKMAKSSLSKERAKRKFANPYAVKAEPTTIKWSAQKPPIAPRSRSGNARTSGAEIGNRRSSASSASKFDIVKVNALAVKKSLSAIEAQTKSVPLDFSVGLGAFKRKRKGKTPM